MQYTSKMLALAGAVVLIAGTALLPAVAAVTPMNVRGTIVSDTPSSLVVKTATGPVTVALTPKTGYVGARTATMADIKPNAFLGIASVQNGATSKALEVTVFPDSMRGAGEGDYGWDLKSGASHSMMTNGAVAMAGTSHSMMTNGSASMMTNGSASKMGGAKVTVSYKGGSRIITIPPSAPIVKLAPGSSKLLAVGAHVFVIPKKTPQGLVGAFVVVGQNGTIPPM